LNKILEDSKVDPDNPLSVIFESELDELFFNNYFLPKDLINSQNNDTRRFRYCQKCQLFKLPRMHHCSQCDQCCLKYDHHCGTAINCIGANNYHLFQLFLVFCIIVRLNAYLVFQYLIYFYI
jgi:DHHC palmitoyltransferase